MAEVLTDVLDSSTAVIIGLDAVIVSVIEETPRVLIVKRADHMLAMPEQRDRQADLETVPDALPFGPFNPARDRTLELGLRRWVREQTDLQLGYVEQLYSFGDRHREPRERAGGPRMVSVGYLALVGPGTPAGGANWRGWYDFFPWEDWREGRPRHIDEVIRPDLERWADAPRESDRRNRRRARIEVAFGLGEAASDEERVLERYELLYQVGLVPEAQRDQGRELPAAPHPLGLPMALDHRRIMATAMGRLRGKIKYRPVVFELMPPTFTLYQLQRAVEALAGVRLHKQNFRRLVEKGGLVEGTGRLDTRTGGRPAELFRFRQEVQRERLYPGVRLPGGRVGG
jgi:hypothetical protein